MGWDWVQGPGRPIMVKVVAPEVGQVLGMVKVWNPSESMVIFFVTKNKEMGNSFPL